MRRYTQLTKEERVKMAEMRQSRKILINSRLFMDPGIRQDCWIPTFVGMTPVVRLSSHNEACPNPELRFVSFCLLVLLLFSPVFRVMPVL
jgi:hypothetical protein